MLRTAGYSTRGVSRVQSPVADTSNSGRGAIRAPISMFELSSRRMGAFSHRHPPCIVDEIILTGAATWTRGSTAISAKVCVPPPDAPVQAIRDASTSGSPSRKSTARMLDHNCAAKG